MGSALSENIWAVLLATVGVFVGWWLRHWAERSFTRDSVPSSPATAWAMNKDVARHVDRLTGLSCGAAFADDLQRRVAQLKRMAAPVAVLLIQINQYDRVIRKYGRRRADQLLVAISQLLRAMVRDMDHVARLDECTFGVVLPGADQEGALIVSERLSQAVSEYHGASGHDTLVFSMSVGAAQLNQNDTSDKIVQRARAALRGEEESVRHIECVLGTC